MPINNNYTKDQVLNSILSHNNVSFDVDRKFVRTLSSIAYKVLDLLKEKQQEKIIISVYKQDKNSFSVHEFLPETKSKNRLFLEVKLSHFQ